MIDFNNPKGRILAFEQKQFGLDTPPAFITLAYGLASKDEIHALQAIQDSQGEDCQRAPLELWLNGQLIGLCHLRISSEMGSEMDDLAPGEPDELYYSVDFEHIWLLDQYRGQGLGRLMATTGAQFAVSTIFEDFVGRLDKKANVIFFATIVSSKGDELYEVFMDVVECQLDMVGRHIGKSFIYKNEGGW